MSDVEFVELIERAKTICCVYKESGLSYFEIAKRAKKLGIYSKIHELVRAKNSKLKLEDFLNPDMHLSDGALKNFLINEKILEYKCNNCGLSKWNGKDITLQLHHVDGNKNNRNLENLVLLCPNCHTQTHNFCGGNKKHHIQEVDEKDLVECIQYSKNILSAVKKYNDKHEKKITERGHIYSYIRKICKKYNIFVGEKIITEDSIKKELFGILEEKKKLLDLRKVKKEKEENLNFETETNKKEKRIKIIRKIHEIRNSNIDFSNLGWVNDVSKILEITPQKVHCWMKKNMPNFYKFNCYKRGQDTSEKSKERNNILKGEKRIRWERIKLIHKIRTSNLDNKDPYYREKLLQLYGNTNGIRWMKKYMPKFCAEHSIKR